MLKKSDLEIYGTKNILQILNYRPKFKRIMQQE